MATQITEEGRALVPAALDERIKEIEAVAKDCNLVTLAQLGSFQRTFQLSKGVQRLRELITQDMMKEIMALQGTALGFRTDKDNQGGYPVNVVRDVTIEAIIRGFHMVSNEVNIIGGRFYATKDGLARKLREFPGLTKLRLNLSVPKIQAPTNAGAPGGGGGTKGGGAVVTASATWELNGRLDQLTERDIPVRMNEGQGADAILGKATRKLEASIWAQLTGSEMPEGDTTDDPPLDGIRNVTPSVETPQTSEVGAAGSKADQLFERLKPKEDAATRTRQLITEMDRLFHEGAGLQALELSVGEGATLESLTDKQLDIYVSYMKAAIKTKTRQAKAPCACTDLDVHEPGCQDPSKPRPGAKGKQPTQGELA